MPSILEELAAQGFGSDLRPDGPPGAIRCGVCGETSDASEFTVEQLRRMEGASDPDEMLAIAALRCPRCGAGGALTLTYGPEVTETDADILERLSPPPPPPMPSA